jgi:ATP-dependent exoDNAse (exonuclease V) beta subunit
VTARLETPSDAQWEAIRCTDEHVLINAGAGTGKTFTVVAKILYSMGVEIRGQVAESPLTLRDIAAITYTTKAAAELKERLRASLRTAGRRREAYEVDSARVGTIHSFCGDILREFALRRGRMAALALLGDAESRVLQSDAIRDTMLAALGVQSVEGLDDLLSAWSVQEIEGWIAQLLARGDHLSGMIAQSNESGQLNSNERALLDLAFQAHTLILARLEQNGRMDYDRMIVWTRDLLRDDAAVRKALQRRIKVLIVDECQDIDPVQREIAYLLADPTSRRADTTRLVLVGDPKQSIFGFRKADVTVWRSIETDLTSSGTGRVVALTESRRSAAPVLAFVDHFVGALLDTPLDAARGQQSFEVDYAPLTSVRDDPDVNSPDETAVEFIAVEAAADGKACKANTVRRSEARAIAARARELHDAGLAWRDIAVLLCGWGSVDIYMSALRDAGVPAYTVRAEGFYECREILDVTVALAAIVDPEDDRMLFGLLRSPFIGLTDESLLHIVRQTTVPCWRELKSVQLPSEEEQGILTNGLALIERLAGIRDRVSVASLIEELLAESGYLAHLELLGETTDGSPAQRIANVRKLVRIASASAALTVSDFLQTIECERELNVKEGEARLFGERDEVVTVTSVHGAKGLEWKCVFWADLIRSKPPLKGKFLLGSAGIALGEPDLDASDQSPVWQSVRADIDAERDAETKRLWYVAATRARDRLILSGIPLGTGSAGRGAPATALKECFAELGTGAEEIPYRASSGVDYTAKVRRASVVSGDDEEAEIAASMTAIPDTAIQRLAVPPVSVAVPWGGGHYSASELEQFQRCQRRHWLTHIAKLPEPAVTATVHVSGSRHGNHGKHEHAGMSATQRGLVVHDVLQHFGDAVTVSELIDTAIGRFSETEDGRKDGAVAGLAAQRDVIIAEIEATLGRPEYRSVRDAAGARSEIPFTFIDGADSVVGRLDLIAPASDGYRIIDVKTTGGMGTHAGDDAAVIIDKAAEYDLQRTLYTRAVEGITGRPVGTFAFDFIDSQKQQDATLSAESRGDADTRLALQVIAMKAGGNALTKDVTECHFCGYRAAGWCPGAAPLTGGGVEKLSWNETPRAM